MQIICIDLISAMLMQTMLSSNLMISAKWEWPTYHGVTKVTYNVRYAITVNRALVVLIQRKMCSSHLERKFPCQVIFMQSCAYKINDTRSLAHMHIHSMSIPMLYAIRNWYVHKMQWTDVVLKMCVRVSMCVMRSNTTIIIHRAYRVNNKTQFYWDLNRVWMARTMASTWLPLLWIRALSLLFMQRDTVQPYYIAKQTKPMTLMTFDITGKQMLSTHSTN